MVLTVPATTPPITVAPHIRPGDPVPSWTVGDTSNHPASLYGRRYTNAWELEMIGPVHFDTDLNTHVTLSHWYLLAGDVTDPTVAFTATIDAWLATPDGAAWTAAAPADATIADLDEHLPARLLWEHGIIRAAPHWQHATITRHTRLTQLAKTPR